MHNRRKAFIYVSNGYDFNPFAKSRAKEANEGAARSIEPEQRAATTGSGNSSSDSDTNPFCEAAATSSPPPISRRELVGADARRPTAPTRRSTRSTRAVSSAGRISTRSSTWSTGRTTSAKSQNSLRVLAELTGGFAVVNSERLRQGAEADRRGDERLLRRRLLLEQSGSARRSAAQIEIKVNGPATYDLNYKPSYTLKPPPAVEVPIASRPERTRPPSIGRPWRCYAPVYTTSCYTFRRRFLSFTRRSTSHSDETWRPPDEIVYQGRMEPRGRAVLCCCSAQRRPARRP